MPECELCAIPVADGGEGTVECFEFLGAEKSRLRYQIRGAERSTPHTQEAAAGLPLVGENKNPALTSTYGVGEQILHAVNSGCTEILLGLGGSATNDGGCGAAAALGVRFIRRDGSLFVPTGETLDQIADIDGSASEKLLQSVLRGT